MIRTLLTIDLMAACCVAAADDPKLESSIQIKVETPTESSPLNKLRVSQLSAVYKKGTFEKHIGACAQGRTDTTAVIEKAPHQCRVSEK